MLSRTLIALLLLLVTGCGDIELANTPPQEQSIVCFGDSLVKGVGASDAESYPMVLQELTGWKVANAGISGHTTTDGVNRLGDFNNLQPGIIIITLGGNDILQRKQWDETRDNLQTLFRRLKETGAVVVFTGITGPLNPTRGRHYATLCEDEGVLYIPDILDGISSNDSLMSDPIHPNAAGYRKMAERIYQELKQAGLLGV